MASGSRPVVSSHEPVATPGGNLHATIAARQGFGAGVRRLRRGFVRRSRGHEAHWCITVHFAAGDGHHGPASQGGRSRPGGAGSEPARCLGRRRSAGDRDAGYAARCRSGPPLSHRTRGHGRTWPTTLVSRWTVTRVAHSGRIDRPDRRHASETDRSAAVLPDLAPAMGMRSPARRSGSLCYPGNHPSPPDRGGSLTGPPSPGELGWSRVSASWSSGWSTYSG